MISYSRYGAKLIYLWGVKTETRSDYIFISSQVEGRLLHFVPFSIIWSDIEERERSLPMLVIKNMPYVYSFFIRLQPISLRMEKSHKYGSKYWVLNSISGFIGLSWAMPYINFVGDFPEHYHFLTISPAITYSQHNQRFPFMNTFNSNLLSFITFIMTNTVSRIFYTNFEIVKKKYVWADGGFIGRNEGNYYLINTIISKWLALFHSM